MNNSFFRLPETASPQVRNAFRVIAIFLAVSLVVTSFVVLQTIQSQAQQLKIETVGLIILLLCEVIALSFTRRGQYVFGIWLTFGTWLTVLILTSALISGIGLVLLISALAIVTLVAGQTLPSRQAVRLIVFGAIMSILTLLVDGFIPTERIIVPGFQNVIVVLLVVVVGLYGYVTVRQFRSYSLQTKIVVWAGSILIIAAIVLVGYSVRTFQQSSIESARENATSIAKAQAELVRGQLDAPLFTARTLAYALSAVKDPTNSVSLSRDQANAMLREVLIENPAYLGTYTLWEPNAFDGSDAAFVGSTAHDRTGRFIPYWVRGADGSIHVEALAEYETPGIGDWYILPRQTKQEVTIAPLIYPIGGEDVVMASFVVPVMRNDRFYGIAGVDAPIGFVQDAVDNLELYGGAGQAVILSDDGTLIAVHKQPDLVNQPASEVYSDFDALQSRLAAGEGFSSLSPDGEYLRIFSPVSIGETGTRWYFSLIIPFDEITAASTIAATRQMAISATLIFVALLVLWLLSAQLVRPILALTEVANAVSQGNLNLTANVQSEDETGVLANAFNLMISQLRTLVGSLESRVAERTRNLELAAEVSRSVSQVRELSVLLNEAAELIRSQFDLYYVQVYLTDETKSNLVLRVGTGSVGQQLLSRAHRLPLNTGSINGRAAVEKHSIVIDDTLASATFRPNPLLPDTRSEMAVPLIVGENVVGVLDLQSNRAGALTEESLTAFEALAGQLAVAIQNASLLEDAEMARVELEKQAARLSRASWQDYLDAVHKPEKMGFIYRQNEVTPLAESETVEPLSKEDSIVSAISVGGETLGNIVVEMDKEKQGAQTEMLVHIISRRVAQQIESLRLLDSTERYRLQSEEAARRLTREGWKSYLDAKSGEGLSYLYDLKEVKPLQNGAGAGSDGNAVNIPLKVREETVGDLAVMDLDVNDSRSIDLVNAVMERLGAHLEGLRLADQTQSALAQSETLAEASLRFTRAADLQELIDSTVTTLNIPVINRAFLTIFNYDEAGTLDYLDIVANWWNGTGLEPAAIGTRLSREALHVMSMFVSQEPIFFNDVQTDAHVDAGSLEFAKRSKLRAVAVLPLYSGLRQIGALILQSEETHTFTQNEVRLFSALAPQIATVVENRRQFEIARKQAERESTLNLISQKIQSATTVEAALQIAARELGRALGAPMTIAQLGLKEKDGAEKKS